MTVLWSWSKVVMWLTVNLESTSLSQLLLNSKRLEDLLQTNWEEQLMKAQAPWCTQTQSPTYGDLWDSLYFYVFLKWCILLVEKLFFFWLFARTVCVRAYMYVCTRVHTMFLKTACSLNTVCVCFSISLWYKIWCFRHIKTWCSKQSFIFADFLTPKCC